jgi:glycine dehydrogenase subunit 1
MGYIPHTAEETRQMLEAVGVGSIDDLFADIPSAVRFKGEMEVPAALTEAEIVADASRLARMDADVELRPCFLGAGAYRHFIPSVVDAIISRPEFATAYTPYQPEASQGTLQAIFEFQSMICRLTALDVANASLYDGSSGTAEAASLAASATGRDKVLVSRALHPEYREVLRTYFAAEDALTVEEVPIRDGVTDLDALGDMLSGEVAAVIVGDPNFFGHIEASEVLVSRVHEAGALVVAVNTDPTSLGLIRRPGQWGADIAVGEAAAMGLPLSFGGPYVGYIAVREEFVKRMPGRLAGLTTDQEGRRGFCLTLQTREQHIRREKATSNICTNQSLCALAVTVWLTALGPHGLREVATASARRARHALSRLEESGVLKRRFSRPFYHEFVMDAKVDPAEIDRALRAKGIVGGLALRRWYPEMGEAILFCATEVLTRSDIDATAAALSELGAHALAR